MVTHDDPMALVEIMQKGEATEHQIYLGLSKRAIKNKNNNRNVLEHIAYDELKHYRILRGITKTDFRPDGLRVWWYTLLANLLGLSFALKLMENGESRAQKNYKRLGRSFPAANAIIRDEQNHEKRLLNMISEERLDYASSIVLGLNDALVELTGALAGLTFALQNGKVVAISGLMVGVAAALSMAASSYLSVREASLGNAKVGKTPLRSAMYTGITYLVTVLLLISPYFILGNVYAAFASMLAIALLVVAGYIFYITTATSQRFLPRFMEMSLIALAVTVISFGIGALARVLFGIAI